MSTTEPTDSTTKVFTQKQIDVSAILAGPIPPGILIFKNHMVLGQEKRAYISLALTVLFTILLFYGLMILPESVLDRIPSFLIPSIYALLASVYFRFFLKKDINTLLDDGAKKASNWFVAGLGLLGVVINLVLVMIISYSQPIYEGEVLKVDGNELYYQETVSISEANKVAEILKTQGFFSPGLGNIVAMKKIGKELFFTIVVDQSFWKDQEAMNFFKGFKSLLELEFQEIIHLKLESFSLNGTSSVKIID